MNLIRDIDAIDYDPSGDVIRAELERLGLAQTEAADLLRIDPRTLRRYLQEPGTPGHAVMPFPHFALLKTTRPRR